MTVAHMDVAFVAFVAYNYLYKSPFVGNYHNVH